jgi:hypothetical protein
MKRRIPVLVGTWLTLGYAAIACGPRGDAQDSPRPAPPEQTENSEETEENTDGEIATPATSNASKTNAKANGIAMGSPITAPGAATTPPPPVPDLYDPAIVPEIELTFDAAAMAVLSSTDPAEKDTWVHGSFKMGAIAFADVGVRRKGSYTFRALPQKASLKVKLNKWVAGQKVYGLTDLTLNNMMGNPTCIAERMTFHIFRSLGLPAQRANTAHVTINGENYGVYANIETPGKKFITRVFGTKAKTLYEVNWGSKWLPGSERGFEIDVADPDAPVGTLPDAQLLFRAVQAANDATLLADLAPHLDTKEWLRYSAAEAVTGQHDGYAYSFYGSHNYFLAGDTDGKFSLIPWSADSTLSDHTGVPDAAIPLPDIVLARCKAGGSCWETYKTEVRSVLAAFEALDLLTLAKTWHEQVDPLVKADPKRENSLSLYNTRTQLLYQWVQTRPGIVRTQLGL